MMIRPLLLAAALLLGSSRPGLRAARPATHYAPGRVLSFQREVIMDTITAVLHGQAVSLCDRKVRLPAVVRLEGLAALRGRAALRTVADARGEFRFFHIPAGTYRLSATCAGYGPLAGDTVRLGTGDGSEVKIGLGCRVPEAR